MKILFAIYGLDEKAYNSMLASAEENGVAIESSDRRYKKIGVRQYISDNPDTDVVVVSEYLESTSPYVASDFEKLLDLKEDLRIVPILNDATMGTVLVKELFQLGIYDAISANDANYDVVFGLIKQGRGRNKAKIYYKISEIADKTDETVNIQGCVEYIAQSREDLLKNTFYIKEQLSDSEFEQVLELLPESVLERIREVDKDHLIFHSDSKKIKFPKEKLSFSLGKLPDLSGVFNKTKSILEKGQDNDKEKVEPIVDLKEVLSNVIVGVVGVQRRSGVTHQAIITAHYLVKHGYRVALVDCTGSNGKCFESIRKYRDVDIGKDCFTYQGVDYYSDVQIEGINAIFSSENQYNFVIIDYGFFSTKVKKDIGRCSIRLVISGSKPWEMGALLSFVNEVKSISGVFEYLVHGVEPESRESQFWLDEIAANCHFIDLQDDPFDGNCYPGLAEIFDRYIIANKIEKKKDWSHKIFPVPISNEKRKKVMPVTKKNEKRGKVQVIGTATCFVTSLKHGTGKTHMTVTLANFLEDAGETVGVITDAEIEDVVGKEIPFCARNEDRSAIISDNQYIVYDVGNYDELTEEELSIAKTADCKIMMCWSDDAYLALLASFVEEQGDSALEWIYAFNNIPQERIKGIANIMSKYDSCYLPTYTSYELPKTVKKIIRSILTMSV